MQVFGAKLQVVYTPYTIVYIKHAEYTMIYSSSIHYIQSRKWIKSPPEIPILCCIIIGPKAYSFLVLFASFRIGGDWAKNSKESKFLC